VAAGAAATIPCTRFASNGRRAVNFGAGKGGVHVALRRQRTAGASAAPRRRARHTPTAPNRKEKAPEGAFKTLRLVRQAD
jgi:hypothetical protein